MTSSYYILHESPDGAQTFTPQPTDKIRAKICGPTAATTGLPERWSRPDYFEGVEPGTLHRLVLERGVLPLWKAEPSVLRKVFLDETRNFVQSAAWSSLGQLEALGWGPVSAADVRAAAPVELAHWVVGWTQGLSVVRVGRGDASFFALVAPLREINGRWIAARVNDSELILQAELGRFYDDRSAKVRGGAELAAAESLAYEATMSTDPPVAFGAHEAGS